MATAPGKSMTLYPGARTLDPNNRSELTSLAVLRDLIWKKPLSNVMKVYTVERDEGRIPDLDIPEKILAISWVAAGGSPKVLGKTFCAKACFVREEYPVMLHAILKHILDHGGSYCGYKNPSEPKPLYGGGQPAMPSNPFEQQTIRANTMNHASGAAITGTPGIGKSMFLLYVLVLRLSAGVTTVLQWGDDGFVVFTAEGSFAAKTVDEIVMDVNLMDYLPADTWFLSDSTLSVKGPLDLFCQACGGSGRFIIQAASPRQERFTWMDKYAVLVKLWMKNWTLPELIMGRGLQHSAPSSERDLQKFMEKFIPSARPAYGYAHNTKPYEYDVMQKLQAIKKEEIAQTLDVAGFGYLKAEISHQIIVSIPDDTNRMQYGLDVPTEWLMHQLVGALRIHDKLANLSMYRLFAAQPQTRVIAGKLLERSFLDYIGLVGQYPVTVMTIKESRGKKRKANGAPVMAKVVFDNKAPESYLRVGQSKKRAFRFSGRALPDTTRYKKLKHFNIGSGPLKTDFETGFYRPIAVNYPTCDGFIVDKDNWRAVLFQVTVRKEHDVKEIAIDWLSEAGIKQIFYVLVTSEHDTELNMTKGVYDKLRKIYRMVIE